MGIIYNVLMHCIVLVTIPDALPLVNEESGREPGLPGVPKLLNNSRVAVRHVVMHVRILCT